MNIIGDSELVNKIAMPHISGILHLQSLFTNNKEQ